MTTIGHVFIPLDREHDGVVPTGEDRAHFESLPVPLALWQSFEECLSDHLSELSEGQIDRDEKFWFEAAHVNAMIAVVEAEAVAAAPAARPNCVIGSYRSWLSPAAPLIVRWASFLLFLEK